MVDPDAIEEATAAIERGDLVVYPTETVYGLGADALDPDAVERVFELKGRDRDEPISLAVPSIDVAVEYASPTVRERRFMHAFLPGPVTIVLERREPVPDALVAGRDRVGIRVPDDEDALALLEATGPLTATSANGSGAESVRSVDDLEDSIGDGVAVVLDGGETPGTASTVVDVGENEIHREGAEADEIEQWLADH